ncbi:cutinase family protein [Nocardia macrotermitis]|uniref:Cutinase n=1 Tax=Nocardia macrotermitis TaxID=2585198 RepID=A0A7K0DB61_9NOCA|nr:cutinase family protein [Nocardia macrotermitis]MQY23020.1 hypothetical protein [Nocardia macrotermitis]
MISHTPIHTHARARRPFRALLCAAVVTVVALCGTTIASATPTTPACPRFTAVLVPGTGTTAPATSAQPAGELAPLAHSLRHRYGADIAVRTPADTASSAVSDGSETAGVHTLSALVAELCSSTRVVLAGYARGAALVGDLATEIGHDQGPVPADRVTAVGLLADPRRNPDTPQLGPSAPGVGIAGPRLQNFGVLAGRVRTLCPAGEISCATSPHAAPALTAIGTLAAGTLPSAGQDTSTPTPTPTSTPRTPSTTTSAAPGGLDPSTVIQEVVTVLAGLSDFAQDVPAIIGDLAQLPGLITTGNIPGLHRVAGDLNNRFAPLVQLASGIDLHLVATALALAAPLDTSGWTEIAAQIVAIVANLDIGHLAADIGQAQEIAWGAVEKLATGDPAGAALALSGIVPVGADLIATAAEAFLGDGGSALSGLANTFSARTTPSTSTALSDLTHPGAHATRSAAAGLPQTEITAAVQHTTQWVQGLLGPAK